VPAGTYEETTNLKRTVTVDSEFTKNAGFAGSCYISTDTGVVSYIAKIDLTGEEEKTMILVGTVTIDSDTGTYTWTPNKYIKYTSKSSGESGDSGGETPTTGNNPVVYTEEKEILTIPAGVYTELDGAKRSVKVMDTTALSVFDVSSLYINVDTATPTLIQTGSLTGNELDTNIYLGKIDMSIETWNMTWVENANISFIA